MPEAKQTFGNKLKAIMNFMKILITKEPNMSAFEKEQYYPNFIHGMRQATENPDWVEMRQSNSYNLKNEFVMDYKIII